MTSSFQVESSKYQVANMDSFAELFNISKAPSFCPTMPYFTCYMLNAAPEGVV